MPNTPDIDVSALAEALNEKLDRDGGNAANAVKEMMAHMGMPSDKYTSLSLPTNGGSVIVPADGYVCIVKDASYNTSQYIQLTRDTWYSVGVQGTGRLRCILPVSKNDEIYVYYDASGTLHAFAFIYTNGNQYLTI